MDVKKNVIFVGYDKMCLVFYKALIMNCLFGNRLFPTVAKLCKDHTKDDNDNGKSLVCAENETPTGKSGEVFVGGVWHRKLPAHTTGGTCVCEPQKEEN